MNEQQKNTMLVCGFIGVLAVIGAGYKHMMFDTKSVASYERKIGEVDKEIRIKDSEYKDILRMVQEKDAMEAKRELLKKALRRLPTNRDTQGFMQAIYAVLRKTGLLQQSLKPATPLEQSQYTEIPYRIKAHGRYHELGQFLTLIEQNPDRFMRVKSLKVSTNVNRPSVHPIEMDLATFMFKNAPIPAPAAAPAKK